MSKLYLNGGAMGFLLSQPDIVYCNICGSVAVDAPEFGWKRLLVESVSEQQAVRDEFLSTLGDEREKMERTYAALPLKDVYGHICRDCLVGGDMKDITTLRIEENWYIDKPETRQKEEKKNPQEAREAFGTIKDAFGF